MGGCMSTASPAQITFLPPTVKAISYLAHTNRHPEELEHPACVPPSYLDKKTGDYPFKAPDLGVKRNMCRHEMGFFNLRCTESLLEIGQYKNAFRRACAGTRYKGPNRLSPEPECPYFKYRHGKSFGLAVRVSRREDILYLSQPYIAGWIDDSLEWTLLQQLNKLGEPFGVSLEDTGAWTVSKALNRMELQLMDTVLMWDSEECDTFKQYHAIEKMVNDVEARYAAKGCKYLKNKHPGPRSAVRELPPMVNPLPYSFVMSYGS